MAEKKGKKPIKGGFPWGFLASLASPLITKGISWLWQKITGKGGEIQGGMYYPPKGMSRIKRKEVNPLINDIIDKAFDQVSAQTGMKIPKYARKQFARDYRRKLYNRIPLPAESGRAMDGGILILPGTMRGPNVM